MKFEEEKNLVKGGLGVAHGRATAGTGHANFLKFCWFWLGKVRHGLCQASGPRGFKFFCFSPHFWTFTYKIN